MSKLEEIKKNLESLEYHDCSDANAEIRWLIDRVENLENVKRCAALVHTECGQGYPSVCNCPVCNLNTALKKVEE